MKITNGLIALGMYIGIMSLVQIVFWIAINGFYINYMFLRMQVAFGVVLFIITMMMTNE